MKLVISSSFFYKSVHSFAKWTIHFVTVIFFLLTLARALLRAQEQKYHSVVVVIVLYMNGTHMRMAVLGVFFRLVRHFLFWRAIFLVTDWFCPLTAFVSPVYADNGILQFWLSTDHETVC